MKVWILKSQERKGQKQRHEWTEGVWGRRGDTGGNPHGERGRERELTAETDRKGT